jgi:hypothetical protein
MLQNSLYYWFFFLASLSLSLNATFSLPQAESGWSCLLEHGEDVRVDPIPIDLLVKGFASPCWLVAVCQECSK